MKPVTVERIMHRDPVTTTPLDTLASAQAVMEREGYRQLPVVEKGTLVGILSDRDLHAHSGYLERTKVDAAMTERLITVGPADTAAHSARVLLEHHINALPVVDGGRLIGIVSRTDLLHLLIELVEGQGEQAS
jgi:CBS domain-containing protein